MLFDTCNEYNRCRPYSEMLTYKPLTNNAVLRKIQKNVNKTHKKIKSKAIYRRYRYRVNVEAIYRGYRYRVNVEAIYRVYLYRVNVEAIYRL